MTQFATIDTTPVYPLAAQPGAVEMLNVMIEAAARYPGLVVQRGTTWDGGLAEADHLTGVITISPAANRAETRCALLACLLHLVQGATDDEEADQRAVREQVARILAPRSVLPADLDDVDVDALAGQMGVDLRTARLSIELARSAR
ncbi:hypothetical protein [Saccharothrix lopnurensis]|uniref:Uncharacterized protein n=1 Tax=Saccharothrix lopnurensis TaxID=1670621 RepID=A0ABW1P6R7_9PSEU